MSEPQTPGLEPEQANVDDASPGAPVERWGIFEWSAEVAGDDHDETALSATFQLGERSVTVAGFDDGPGSYRVRFMPDAPGDWCFQIRSSLAGAGRAQRVVHVRRSWACEPRTGARQRRASTSPTPTARRTAPSARPATPGTTSRAELRSQTLDSLRDGPFNKLRMCVFPKRYIYNADEPELHAFAQKADGSLDFDRFEPRFFRQLEARIGELQALGIEADLILFHPYDSWGYQDMTRRAGRALPALPRRAPGRLPQRVVVDRQRVRPHGQAARALAALPGGPGGGRPLPAPRLHPQRRAHVRPPPPRASRSVSVQSWDVKRTREWRERYGKPVVNDEPEYEGNMPLPWGNISARELVHRFWVTVLSGGYVGHGETYLDDQRHPVVVEGRRAAGREPAAASPSCAASWRRPAARWSRSSPPGSGPRVAARRRDTWLYYFGEHQPPPLGLWPAHRAGDYLVDLIDPWEMTVTPDPALAAPTAHGICRAATKSIRRPSAWTCRAPLPGLRVRKHLRRPVGDPRRRSAAVPVTGCTRYLT